jgi:hypothetical protein
MTKENEKKSVFRLRLDESFVDRIKAKYGKETKDLSKEETIVWALDKFLSFQEFVSDPLGRGL